jgi:cobalt-zinc-cadmium resistance protein CzcA
LFKIFEEKEFKKPKFKKHISGTYILLFLFATSFGFAQENNAELDSIMNKALQNNKLVKAGQLQIDKANANVKTAYSFDKTNVYYSYDQNNLALNNEPLKVFGVQQSFAFPTIYGAQRKVYKAELESQKASFELQKNKLKFEVSKVYHQIVYVQHQEKLYSYLDSLYQNFSKASNRRFELGETNYLEKITAEAKFRKISTKLSQLDKEKKAQLEVLQALIQSEEIITIKANDVKPINNLLDNSSKALYGTYFESITSKYKSNEQLQKQNWLPDVNIEYFQGTNTGITQSLYGFQVGVAVPILFNGNVAKSKVAKLESQAWEQQKQYELIKIDAHIKQKNSELDQHNQAIDYYNLYGKKVSQEIIKVANMSYKQGEIDFFQFIQSLENATTIQVDYLEAVFQYNQTQLDLQYINIQ